nr:hypothetical protein [uncultured Mucilaginibacter sp.]
MTIFLFGAGASFGSGQVDPCPPPLGSDLYSALKRIYPSSWGSFDSTLQYKFNTDFETGMAQLIDQTGHLIPGLMQQMAIFFSRFGLSSYHDNLYKSLIKELKKRELLPATILSSLNYDCLCEIAGFHEGIKIDYFGNNDEQTAKIWKIHGSCNFKLEGIDATRNISFGTGIKFDGGSIQILNPADVPKTYRGNTALYPSMCLYAKDKPLAIAEGLITSYQQDWSTMILNADKIFVIGVRPLSEDSHIWQPIANSKGSLYFVGDQNEFENWIAVNRQSKTNEFLGKYWSESESAIYMKL